MGLRSLTAALCAAVLALLACVASSEAATCDGTPSRACLLPFPNDVGQTKRDGASTTKVRVNLSRSVMPANSKGVRIDPTALNQGDGFSPGQSIVVHVPSLKTQAQFAATGIVDITDIGTYAERGQKLLLLDEATGKRQLVWGELDANATTNASRNVLIHPGKNLTPGRRYVVVLRGLKDKQPKRLAATWTPAVRAAMKKAKVATSSVYLAWDFTVASNRFITGRLLAMRDDAFRQLGDTNLADGVIQGRPPTFAVTGVTDYTVDQDPLIARKVTGTFEVPCYMKEAGCPPGGRLNLDIASTYSTPTQQAGNVQTATFTCNIPRAAFGAPSHIATYGHGLLGNQTQVDEQNIKDMSAEHDFTFCATDWYGMADKDVPAAIAALQDFSKFPNFVERQAQGIVAQLYLGRLLAHPQGLVTDPAFAGLLDVAGGLSWDSNSQGAIFGGTTTAVSPDFPRAVLGVATMNYSVLLQRSTDFDVYSKILTPAYPNVGQQATILSIVQLLWDHSDTNGWTQYMTTSPAPGTIAHTVLMHVAVGDHQVANVQSDVEARSIGARIYRPSELQGRTTDKAPHFGLEALGPFPDRRSGVVWWDGGPQTALAPTTNTPPSAASGKDPHSFPRSTRAARQQKATFLLGGGIVDVCGAKPCLTDNYG